MAITTCEDCGASIDTDYHAELYREDTGKWVCEECRPLTEECQTCDGMGETVVSALGEFVDIQATQPREYWDRCPSCGGSGEVDG